MTYNAATVVRAKKTNSFAALLVLICMGPAQAGAPLRQNDKSADSIANRAIVTSATFMLVDTDGNLRIRGRSFRLAGIRLPRFAVCADQTGRRWGCGTAAFVTWSKLFASGNVRCVLAVGQSVRPNCNIAGENVSLRLVRSGWAVVDDTDADPKFKDAQASAKQMKRGIWSPDAMKVFWR